MQVTAPGETQQQPLARQEQVGPPSSGGRCGKLNPPAGHRLRGELAACWASSLWFRRRQACLAKWHTGFGVTQSAGSASSGSMGLAGLSPELRREWQRQAAPRRVRLGGWDAGPVGRSPHVVFPKFKWANSVARSMTTSPWEVCLRSCDKESNIYIV